MDIAIVDDEKVIREQVKGMIEKQYPECGLYTCKTCGELLCMEKHFDIIFLDIQMEGMNGIEAARILFERNERSVLIFITGIRDYVFEAFDVAAFHYLLKPLDEKKFQEVLNRAVKEAEKRKDCGQTQLFIKTRNRNITLNQTDIMYVESRGRKADIHTTEEVVEIYAAMKGLEEQLGGSFYRCHRGYLVNMAYITEYNNDSIRLSNGESIYLSKERYNAFVKAYMRYLRNGGTACV